MNEHEIEKLVSILRRVISQIILHPNELVIESVCMARSATIHVRASRGDTRRIIGKDGIHYRALMGYVAAFGMAHGYDVELDKIAEPQTGELDRYPEFKIRDVWPKAQIEQLLSDMAVEVFSASSVRTVDGPNGSTSIDLTVCGERAELVEAMDVAFKTLFKAIGRANGRRLFLSVVPGNPAEKQPVTAAGRYAGET